VDIIIEDSTLPDIDIVIAAMIIKYPSPVQSKGTSGVIHTSAVSVGSVIVNRAAVHDEFSFIVDPATISGGRIATNFATAPTQSRMIPPFNVGQLEPISYRHLRGIKILYKSKRCDKINFGAKILKMG
jgi:hypothetical protein